ncbi:hypothetical protein Ahy_B01g053379 [Arachis hypogaea]|uniref:Protein kinase domain-containing protein n=1 Tax=Arachis hypogaea TaxID=3818 RepID=A0A445ARN0_ARAHY|nr:hypothetical protein Ahy_B01g053379 [Arachis hypogaea]
MGTSLVLNVKREVSIMSKLNHPNIVKLHEVLATKTKIYFVLEFVKVSKGRFSEDLARKYFQQLISAVGYCHSRGIFHRDLKPENLLLDENGNLKVSDFGLSAVKDQVSPKILKSLFVPSWFGFVVAILAAVKFAVDAIVIVVKGYKIVTSMP